MVDNPAGSHDGDEVRVRGMGNAGTNGKESGDFVCRVGVPSERVTQGQAIGLEIVGFFLPFTLVSLLSLALGLGGGVPVVDLVFLAVGVLIACQDGVAHKSRRWWRNAWYAMRNGFAIGLVIALLFLLMSSCSASALTAAPRGGAGGLNA